MNKLCALLHRSELRDLVDIEALLANGGELERALEDAPRKDEGISALTPAWTLGGWDVEEAARSSGPEHRAVDLRRFRDRLLARIAGENPSGEQP